MKKTDLEVSRNATLAIGLSAVAWGLWWLPVRWLSRAGLQGDLVSVSVYLLGALLLFPFAVKRWRKDQAGWGAICAIGIVLGATLAMTNAALLRGQVVRVLLLFYLAPIWATLVGVLVLRERLTLGRVLSVAMGLLGAATVLGGASGVPLPSSLADWMGFLAGVTFAIGALLIRLVEGRGISSSDPTIQTLGIFIFAGIIGLGFLVLLPNYDLVSPATAWSAVPFALLVSAFWLIPQMWLFTWGAAQISPGRVSIIMLGEPLIAVVSAGVLLKEPLTWREVTGCLLIISAAFIETARSDSSGD